MVICADGAILIDELGRSSYFCKSSLYKEKGLDSQSHYHSTIQRFILVYTHSFCDIALKDRVTPLPSQN